MNLIAFLVLAICYTASNVQGFAPRLPKFVSHDRTATPLPRHSAAKFDPADFISVSLQKPLGLSLEEVEENKKRGVTVDGVDDGGSAKASGKVRSGLFLVSVNGMDTKYENFDTILNAIKSAPDNKPLDLVFIPPGKVFKGPATVSVTTPDGKQLTIQTLKGANMRRTLQESGIVIYSDKSKFTNCGGAGNCGTCAVTVTDNKDWEPRAKFEELRLKKYAATARLSCMAEIEGDCSIAVLPAQTGPVSV